MATMRGNIELEGPFKKALEGVMEMAGVRMSGILGVWVKCYKALPP